MSDSLVVSTTKGHTMKVRVINLDGSETTYYFDPEHWTEINEFYGKLIQDGEIKTAFITMG